MKLERYRQPWSIPLEDRKPIDKLFLKFTITCASDIKGLINLALEDADRITIRLDGKEIPSEKNGWWVDEAITTVPIVPEGEVLSKGTHTLELDIPFGLLTNVERVYLLGDFAVDVRGTEATLSPLDLSTIRFGDWTRQGLPFYAGNMIYHCSFTLPENCGSTFALDIPHYEGPLVTALLDPSPSPSLSPSASTHHLLLHPTYTYFPTSPGPHTLLLTSYGNRENSFGTIHLPSGKTHWHGPNTFRYEHDWWMEEYNVKPMGIMQAPKIKVEGREDVVTVRRSKVQKWYN